jgi:hypothetical protein
MEHKVRLLEIIWPSGIVQKLTDVAADQIITVREPERIAGKDR